MAAATPVLRLVVPATMALATGGCLAWLAWSLAPLRRFLAPSDVTDELRLPVIGMLAEPQADQVVLREQLRRRSTTIRRTTIVCEWALTAAVLICLFQALAESPFSARFAEDPFGTFAETVNARKAGN